MKKLSVLLAVFLLTACGGGATTTTGEGKAVYDNHGKEATVTAKVTLEDGKIKELEIDETYPDPETNEDSTKKTLKEKYNMKTKSGIGKEWYEQIEFLEDELKGTDGKIALDEKGYATDEDVKTGCTINLTNIQAAIDDAIAQAK